MNPIGFRFIKHFYLFLQICEIGREYRWGDDGGHNVLIINYYILIINISLFEMKFGAKKVFFSLKKNIFLPHKKTVERFVMIATTQKQMLNHFSLFFCNN
jgi:hypothetical protein